MKDIMKIAKSIEKLGSMIESVREIIKNETKRNNKKMACYQLHQILVYQEICQQLKLTYQGEERGKIRAGDETRRTGQNF